MTNKHMFLRLWRQLSVKRRRQFFIVLAMMLAGAIAEVLALGAVIPFLALIAEPGRLSRYPAVAEVLARFGLKSTADVLLAMTAIFVGAAIGAAIVRIVLTWVSGKYVQLVGHDLSVRLYERILHQPYAYHAAHNTSETLAAINKIQLVTQGFVLPLLQSMSALVMGSFIVAALVYVDPLISLSGFVGFGFIYLVVSLATNDRLSANSSIISRTQAQRIQATQEGLGGIRDILIDNTQSLFVKRFSLYDASFRHALATTVFIGTAPRFAIEAAGMVLIALLAYYTSQDNGLTAVLPILGALALGAQRLLPLMQLIYNGWTQIASNSMVMSDVLKLLETPMPSDHLFDSQSRLPFQSKIAFDNVSFSYQDGQNLVVENLNFVIEKGTKVGVIGKTGSGKSTTIDLFMGLLEPTSGRITIDGCALDASTRRNWQRQIAHVPQTIFLADASIAENIAFGIGIAKIDEDRVREAARRAELADFVEGLPERYGTMVGENGVRLSGGQRQRIGIARALYKDADVLIFDEATSALDTGTEAVVMEAIERLERELTIVIIAHRLSTIAFCDQVIRLDRGRVAETGSYEQVVPAGMGQSAH